MTSLISTSQSCSFHPLLCTHAGLVRMRLLLSPSRCSLAPVHQKHVDLGLRLLFFHISHPSHSHVKPRFLSRAYLVQQTYRLILHVPRYQLLNSHNTVPRRVVTTATRKMKTLNIAVRVLPRGFFPLRSQALFLPDPCPPIIPNPTQLWRDWITVYPKCL